MLVNSAAVRCKRTEYASVDDARKVRQQLIDSGALNQAIVKTGPTIVEIADQAAY